ncbi:MAG: PDZ domain-containing protein [Bacilli bacterium]|nr:PDZ domain-containing protein [Bacilli bacterium]
MINKIYEYIKSFIKECYRELIVLFVIFLVFYIELPYVIYTPGGTINLNERIIIDEGYDSDGEINMSYVTMVKGTIPNILLSKIIKNWDVEKASNVTYDGDSVKETIKKDKLSMEESQDNATIAAYQLTKHDLEITKYHNIVTYITDEADTTLQEYDEIVAINDKEVTSLENMKEIVNLYQEGDTLDIKVIRNKKEVMTTAKIYQTDDGLKVGVTIVTDVDFKTDPKIEIESKNSESGPSGGLMTALAIYNKLTKDDITKGKKVAGTGTIDALGNVGEIGGVKYKVLGAIDDDMDVFICPEENYEEAVKTLNSTDDDLIIIKAKTLSDAINELQKL